jgi:catechol 2,3-dioxygenase-like lactoylglutathione lyase family enzyme
MKKTRYLDHIDLRVSDLKRARKFYGKLLPALGFSCDRSSGRWGIFYAAGGDKPDAFFGFTQDRRHQPNGTRLAFWAETREEVDRLARLVRKIGGKCLEGPEVCRAYSRGYYACFFEDPDGNKWRFVGGKVRLFRVSGLHSPALSRCLRSDREYLSSHRVFARITAAR